MDIFHNIKGLIPINENVTVDAKYAVLVSSTIPGFSLQNAAHAADTLHSFGEPDLASMPRALNTTPPSFGLVLYTDRKISEIQEDLNDAFTIPNANPNNPNRINSYDLTAAPLDPAIWTPFDTLRAKETGANSKVLDALIKQREKLADVVKSNKENVAEKSQVAKDFHDSLNEASTIKDKIRVRDEAIFALRDIEMAIKALTGLPGVEQSDLDEISSTKPEMEKIIKEINKNFEQKKNKILESLSEIERSPGRMSDNEVADVVGDIGNDILLINDSKAISDADKEKIQAAFRKVRDKYKVGPKQVEVAVVSSKFANIGRKYKLFVSKEYKSEHQLMQDYYHIQDDLDKLKQTAPKEYAKYYRGLENQYLYKMGKLNTSKNKKNFNKKKGQKEKITLNTYEKNNQTLVTNKEDAGGTIVMDYGDGKTFTEYPIDVHLPLGKTVVIDNLQQIENDDSKGNRSQNVNRFYHTLKRGLASALGYEPQGGAARAIAATKGANKLLGELFGWTIGVTAGAVIGTGKGLASKANGESFNKGFREGNEIGEKTGDAFKWEMINNPDELNPAIAEFGEYVNRKLGLRTSYYDNSQYLSTGRGAYVASPKRLRESAGAVPIAPTGIPGTVMNVPGTIHGIGDSIPPTPDQTPYKDGVKGTKTDSGSGDQFPTVSFTANKKKRNT